MNNYTYFVATFPTLQLNEKPPFSFEQFMGECQQQLNKQDYLDLHHFFAGNIDYSYKNKIVRRWQLFENDLNFEIIFFRAKRLKKDPYQFIPRNWAPNPEFTKRLQPLDQEENLLLAEKGIDDLRWHGINDLVQGDFFNFNNVFAFAIQLAILDRYEVVAEADTEQLMKQFDDIQLDYAV